MHIRYIPNNSTGIKVTANLCFIANMKGGSNKNSNKILPLSQLMFLPTLPNHPLQIPRITWPKEIPPSIPPIATKPKILKGHVRVRQHIPWEPLTHLALREIPSPTPRHCPRNVFLHYLL